MILRNQFPVSGRRWCCVISVYLVIVVIVAGIFCVSRADAHGPAQWIADGRYRDLKPPNTLCCGSTDCAELRDDEVESVKGGYHIIPLDEFVPMSDVQWSKPGGYWRCHYPDEVYSDSPPLWVWR
jgi:hypothetical protein